MLVELRITNYAVIEDVALRFEPGLIVLTGETGAGKSIIVGALSLLLGERASSDVIRAGEERSVVEAAFDVSGRADLRRRCEETGIEAEDGWLILKRELNASGRNRAWINGSPATATLIGEFGQALVDLHGQHEHQALLHSGPQREILDAYAGAEGLAAELREAWGELSSVRREREELEDRRRRIEERAELLRHQAEEIEAAEIDSAEEDAALAEEERRLAHAEELLQRSSALYDAVYGADRSVYGLLGELRRELAALAKIDPATDAEFSELFDAAYYALQELGERIAGYRDGIELSPARLERVRARIDTLYRLKSKYGPGLEEVAEAGRHAREELDRLDLADFELEELAKRERELSERAERLGGDLSAERRRAAQRLEGEVTALLPELGMPDGIFEIALEERPQVTAVGAEDVEFRVTLNKGFEPRALSRVASGGELSRVMLALKTILARLDRTPTLIFDEIDSGIGGIVGGKVGEKLKAVAEAHQVFVITHLAQIAARADHHLLVSKSAHKGKSATDVSELEGDERVRDLARMLGGDPEREASLKHARDLLDASSD